MRNKNQVDYKNYIAFRIFSNKFKDDIQHTSIQKHALLGDRMLVPNMYTVYLPNLKKENPVEADLGDALGAAAEEEIKMNEIEVAMKIAQPRFETSKDEKKPESEELKVTDSEAEASPDVEKAKRETGTESLTNNIMSLPKQEHENLIPTISAMTSGAEEPKPDDYARGSINRQLDEDDRNSKDPKKKLKAAAGSDGCCK